MEALRRDLFKGLALIAAPLLPMLPVTAKAVPNRASLRITMVNCKNRKVPPLINAFSNSVLEFMDVTQFEPNDEVWKYNAKQYSFSLLKPLRQERAIYDYSIMCDDRNNTPTMCDLNHKNIVVCIRESVFPREYHLDFNIE